MSWWEKPFAVSGFVLAGGRSSRMGRDKALLELAGKPLVAHAMVKLKRICSETAILTSNEELGRFGTVVKDLHPDCGPMSGIETALTHAKHVWSLILPVDVPFVPTRLLWDLVREVGEMGRQFGTRLAFYNVDGVPQPTLLLIHRDFAPYLTLALAEGRFKLLPELRAAAEDIGVRRIPPSVHAILEAHWSHDCVYRADPVSMAGPDWTNPSPIQEAATHLFFANLNTPEDFAEAEKHAELLDT